MMPPTNGGAAVNSEPFLGPLSRAARGAGSASLTTVLVAFAANLLVAVAKSGAAVVTGSASMLAEAAHSWADTGNEVFLHGNSTIDKMIIQHFFSHLSLLHF